MALYSSGIDARIPTVISVLRLRSGPVDAVSSSLSGRASHRRRKICTAANQPALHGLGLNLAPSGSRLKFELVMNDWVR